MQLSFEVKDEYVKAYIEALEKVNTADISDKEAFRLVMKTFKNAGATVLSAIEEHLEEVIEVQGYEQKL
jgi:predicted glycosyltransferase involved in capsule biosynthesis